MTAKLTDDLQQAVDAHGGQPLRAEHDGTHKAYFIYTEQMHQRAIKALKQQEDLLAIQAGIDAMKAGRVIPLTDAAERIREELGFSPRAQ